MVYDIKQLIQYNRHPGVKVLTPPQDNKTESRAQEKNWLITMSELN